MHARQNLPMVAGRKAFEHVAVWLPPLALAIPSTASANAGTPLMWAGALHLFLGNAVIGLIEGAILAWLLRARFGRAIFVMVIGNYVAWWCCAACSPIIERLVTGYLGPLPLLKVGVLVRDTVAATFVASLVIEAPFSYLATCVRSARKEDRGPKFLRFTFSHIAAQSTTYALLLLWYSHASQTSLLRIQVQPDLRSRLPNGSLQFRDSRGNLVKTALRGGAVEPLNANGQLIAQQPFPPARTLDLNSGWTVHTTDWATALVAESRNGARLFVALETPLINWKATDATVLPGGYVVYQLGAQIVVLDMNKRTIAPLVAGTEPYVILDQ